MWPTSPNASPPLRLSRNRSAAKSKDDSGGGGGGDDANSTYASSNTTNTGRVNSRRKSSSEIRLPSGLLGEQTKSTFARGFDRTAFSIAGTSRLKSRRRGTSTKRAAFTSALNGYMPNEGGQLITTSPGVMVARKARSINSS